jgi:hypothetical protein
MYSPMRYSESSPTSAPMAAVAAARTWKPGRPSDCTKSPSATTRSPTGGSVDRLTAAFAAASAWRYLAHPSARAPCSTGTAVSWRGSSDPLLGLCRDPFRDRLGGLDVQEVTDVGDDLQRVRGGEPMSVVDLRGEEAAVVGTVELQQGHRDRLR